MIDLSIEAGMESQLEMVRWLGKEYLRPLGIEADRRGEPLPADHPFFKKAMEMGVGGRGLMGEGGQERREGPQTNARRTVLLAEEMAYWDRGMAVALPGPGLGGPPVQFMGTKDQKTRFLGIFAERSTPRWAAFAMTEPGAGSDVARICTTARKEGNFYVINGEKMFCSNGARSSWVVVWATVDKNLGRDGHRAFVVERETPGFQVARIEHKMGLVAYESAALVFEDCKVPADNLLGGEAYYGKKAGFKGAMRAFDLTRPTVAVMAIGIGRAAYEYAKNFVKDQYDLHRPIPRYQRLTEKLAYMQRKLDVGRLLCWRAAWLVDMGKSNSLEASMAKVYCPPVAQEATSLAMEILGDAGARNDYFVEKLFRDVKALDIVEGTGQIQRVIIARRLVGLPSAER